MPRKRGSTLYENSPALQCWVNRSNKAPVPAGTKEPPDLAQVDAAFLPSLTGLGASPDAYPALKCRAIFETDSRRFPQIFDEEIGVLS